ncbi:MAG: GHKL domain-containing protein [Clostridium sp.]|uniref:GHKL domain-containing protein n=1 Tax=Clostridium sp. TaxID=1506 RepID=UPI0030699E95
MIIFLTINLLINITHSLFYLDAKKYKEVNKIYAFMLLIFPVVVKYILILNLGNYNNSYKHIITWLLYLPLIIYITKNNKYQSIIVFMIVLCISTFIMSSAIVLLRTIIGDEYITSRNLGIVVITLNSITVYISYKYVRLPIRRLLKSFEGKSGAFWITPSVIFFFIYVIYSEIFKKEVAIEFFVIGLVIIVLVGIIVAIKSLDGILRKNAILSQEIATYDKIINMHLHYYEELNYKEHCLKIQKHDFKHMLSTVSTLANGEKNDLILELIENYVVNIKDINLKRYCENDVINANIAYYFSRAQKSGVKCSCRINIENDINISAGNLTNIMGNILENAVNATCILNGDRFIDLTGDMYKESFVIKCKNNFNKDMGIHGEGYGLLSIESICKKHNGYYKINKEGNIFEVIAILSVKKDRI